ncbi:hypothetical protein BVRB_6g156220 [Beta vulgaris subsp. vulgaris]|uniref:Uncharacterized protein n=1 Tax=Beta vulgaris subsp. vulgaris TaxID=3555 RepID=A0A0J8E2J3_BETVV|nr:hypothetical protein BVRB_6g156220 [Beta vulgaris subsp. vulgaris]
MAAYTLKSDKMFLRCIDMEGIEVYELDSPYLYPVKGKHWKHVGISIGLGKTYEALKIGDKEIKDVDLQTLIKDLFTSRLIVNREGLCFLATTGVTAVVLEVEYYRLYDVFNWSKYMVKTSLNTKWTRKDIVDGRPLEIIVTAGSNSEDLTEKEKELEEEKNKHKVQLEELERKKEEELKEKQDEVDNMKQKLADAERKNQEGLKNTQDEIAELKRKHQEDLTHLETEKEKELEEKQEKIDELDEELGEKQKQNENLEDELKIYSFQKSGFSAPHDFYRRIVKTVEISVPSSEFIINQIQHKGRDWPPSDLPKILTPLRAVPTVQKRNITFEVASLSYYFDFNNWRTLRVAWSLPRKDEGGKFQEKLHDVVYYDGNSYQAEAYNGKEIISSPCRAEHLARVGCLKLRYIMGVGLKLTL